MGCENCKNCGGGGLTLTPPELALLRRLGETAFLPVAAGYDRETPVYREEPGDFAAAILALSAKGLVRVDYDIPLQNFDYQAYAPWPLHGSMALTGWGQEILEQLEILGIEGEEPPC